jgi:hypothetical protein
VELTQRRRLVEKVKCRGCHDRVQRVIPNGRCSAGPLCHCTQRSLRSAPADTPTAEETADRRAALPHFRTA